MTVDVQPLGLEGPRVAAALGHLEAVKVLIDAGVSVDSRTARGDTALKLAVIRQRDESVFYLLDRHAHPDLTDVRGDTPCMKRLATTRPASSVPFSRRVPGCCPIVTGVLRPTRLGTGRRICCRC